MPALLYLALLAQALSEALVWIGAAGISGSVTALPALADALTIRRHGRGVRGRRGRLERARAG